MDINLLPGRWLNYHDAGRGRHRVHILPRSSLEAGVVRQLPRASELTDPAQDRRLRNLPQLRGGRSAHRRRARRTARRMGGRPSLLDTWCPQETGGLTDAICRSITNINRMTNPDNTSGDLTLEHEDVQAENCSLTPHAAVTLASVSSRGFLLPDRARDRATLSTFA